MDVCQRHCCHKTEHFLNKHLTQLSGSLQDPQINFPNLTCVCTFQTSCCPDLRKHRALLFTEQCCGYLESWFQWERIQSFLRSTIMTSAQFQLLCYSFSPLRYDLNSFLSFLCGGVMIQTPNKKASCQTKQRTHIFSQTFFFFRLDIPPFVPARTVLELLESEDVCENKIPVKAEATDTKVNKHKPQLIVFHIIRCLDRMICNGIFSPFGTRPQAETRTPGWKRKRRTCSGCATRYLWRWWSWVGSASASGWNSAFLPFVHSGQPDFILFKPFRGNVLQSRKSGLLCLWGVAAVLLCGWNEICSGPQRQNHVV